MNDHTQTLEQRVAELERLVADLLGGRSELAVRRLVVLDVHDQERITLEVRDGHDATIEAASGGAHARLSAGPAGWDLPAEVNHHASIEAGVVDTGAGLSVAPVGGGALVSRLSLDEYQPSGSLGSQRVELSVDGLDGASSDADAPNDPTGGWAEVIRLRECLANVQGWALEGLHPVTE